MPDYFELGQSFNGDGCFRMVRNAQYKKDIQEFVKSNKKENLYMSVYKFTQYSLNEEKPIYETAVIDKIFIEIDSDDHGLIDKHAWQQLRKLLDWCKTEQFANGGEINPQIFFSGRSGYHVIFNFKVPEQSLKDSRIVKVLVKKLQEKTGVNIDLQANHGFTQMRRIPNTKNHKSGYYCIPLTVDEAYNYAPSKILELAKKPRKIDNFTGYSPYFHDIIIGLKDYLTTGSKRVESINRNNIPYKRNTQYIKDNNLPVIRPCIARMLRKYNPTFQERTYIATEMVRCDYEDYDIHQIFKHFKSYSHDKTQWHLNKIRDKNLYAPSCATLEMNGLCEPRLHKDNDFKRGLANTLKEKGVGGGGPTPSESP